MPFAHRDVSLLTSDQRIEFFVRGERFATYRYASGTMPGFSAIYACGERALTQPSENGTALWLEHDNLVRIPALPSTPLTSLTPISDLSHDDETVFTVNPAKKPDKESVGETSNVPETLDMMARRGTYSVGFRQVCQWADRNGVPGLVETRTIRVSPGPSEGGILDLTFELKALKGAGVVLEKTERSLLCVRAAPTLFSTAPFQFGGGQLRNSLGTYGSSEVHGQRAKWCACIGVVNNETVGFALLEHPSNPFFPSPWRAEKNGIFSPSLFEWQSVTIPPDTTLTLRYRLISHTGYVDQGWADARLSDFVQ